MIKGLLKEEIIIYALPPPTMVPPYCHATSNPLEIPLIDRNYDCPVYCGMQIKTSWIQREDTDHGLALVLATESVVYGPAVSVSPENLLKIQNLSCHPRPNEP